MRFLLLFFKGISHRQKTHPFNGQNVGHNRASVPVHLLATEPQVLKMFQNIFESKTNPFQPNNLFWECVEWLKNVRENVGKMSFFLFFFQKLQVFAVLNQKRVILVMWRS